jgi:glycopeptide antibiotics resistance protein
LYNFENLKKIRQKVQDGKILTLFFSALCILIIFYFSWLPSGEFGKETILPAWLLAWSNTYFNLRTALPFLFLGSFTAIKNNAYLAFFSCIVVVCIAEAGQFFIADRNPDLLDIVFGALGSIVGIGIVQFFRRKKNCKTKVERQN